MTHIAIKISSLVLTENLKKREKSWGPLSPKASACALFRAQWILFFFFFRVEENIYNNFLENILTDIFTIEFGKCVKLTY